MPRSTPWKDEYTLLCEDCGYIIEDLDESLPCPECGKPIAESLPHDREGSPWQQHRSMTNLIMTWFLVLFQSKKLCGQLNVNEDTARSLMRTGLLAGLAIPSLVMFIFITIESIQYGLVTEAIYSFIIIAVVLLILYLVAVIYATLGSLRLRFYARLRGIRLPGSTIWTIVGHASLGLTIVPIGITAAFVIASPATVSDMDQRSALFNASLIAAAIVGWASLPAALILFEIFLFTGARAMQYRNKLSSLESGELMPPLIEDSEDES